MPSSSILPPLKIANLALQREDADVERITRAKIFRTRRKSSLAEIPRTGISQARKFPKLGNPSRRYGQFLRRATEYAGRCFGMLEWGARVLVKCRRGGRWGFFSREAEGRVDCGMVL